MRTPYGVYTCIFDFLHYRYLLLIVCLIVCMLYMSKHPSEKSHIYVVFVKKTLRAGHKPLRLASCAAKGDSMVRQLT